MFYGIIGPRDFEGEEYRNQEYINKALSTFTDMELMVSGGSKGCETLAEKWAIETDIERKIIRPNISLHGTEAAFNIRNIEILELSNALIVFWDGTGAIIVDVIVHAMKVKKEVNLLPLV